MNDDMISWVLWSQCVKFFATHDLRKTTLVFLKQKTRRKKSEGESTRVVCTGHKKKKVPPEKKLGVVLVNTSRSLKLEEAAGLSPTHPPFRVI